MRTSSSPARPRMAPPRVLQVSEVPARFAARDHPRIVLITGQGGQQPYRRGRQGNRSPPSLGVGQPQLARIEFDGFRVVTPGAWLKEDD